MNQTTANPNLSKLKQDWNDLVAAEMAAGRSRVEALQAVGRRRPKLREQLVAAANG